MSAREALDELGKAYTVDPYRFVVLDMQMPDMDGEGLASAIRADARYKGVPLILLSSIGSRGTTQEMLEKGFAAWLTKPVRRSTLLNTVLEVMECPELATARASHGYTPDTNISCMTARILVAEDNAVNQKVALRMLEKWGCRADAVANGREALVALERIPYDIILMDVQMPEMDGFEATAEIRRREDTTGKHIPIIAMTAHAMEGDRERCLEAGMDDYVAKPITSRDLFAALSRWGANNQERAMETIGNGIDNRVVFDFDRLHKSCGDDFEFEQEVLTVFLRSAQTTLTNLDTVITIEQASEVEMQAHGLKGSCRTLGAEILGEICLELEIMGKDGDLTGAHAALGRAQREYEKLRIVLEQYIQAKAA